MKYELRLKNKGSRQKIQKGRTRRLARPAIANRPFQTSIRNSSVLWFANVSRASLDKTARSAVSSEPSRTSTLLGLTHFFLFCHSRVGGNQVCGRFLEPWILVPRLREDKLHGNDADCVSPTCNAFPRKIYENSGNPIFEASRGFTRSPGAEF